MKLDKLTSIAWKTFNNAGGLDKASMSVAVMAVLDAIAEDVETNLRGFRKNELDHFVSAIRAMKE